ncbi:MAG TPA: transglycosylase family protein [Egicoccus sp.]|nr:transglycosylase family protein [Egicoccus sp.]HSK22916.1 transglycosylase family protein [Egicoccus sp.]
MSSRARTTRTTSSHRVVVRLAAAGALVAAATAAVTIDAAADEPEASGAVVRTVTVTPADQVEPRAAEDAPLTAAITEAVEARTELVAAEPEPEPEPAPVADEGVDAGVWDRVAQCESGGNWQINTGNGFYGGLQFELPSWQWVGGKGYPHENSKAEQIRRAEILLERQGWIAWPVCSKKLGLR